MSTELSGLTCSQIEQEQSGIAEKAQHHGASIKSSRQRNQVAGYFSAFFLPALVAVKQNSSDKEALDSLQMRWDVLTSAAKVKHCPFNPDIVFRGAAR
ncbi:MAG: hypothetical protein ACKVH1_18120 [Alphaproteobacteria bacterium]